MTKEQAQTLINEFGIDELLLNSEDANSLQDANPELLEACSALHSFAYSPEQENKPKVEKMEIKDKFEAVDDDYLKFERIKNKKATRPDVHAFILLEELFPSERNMDLIDSAEHDIYYFSIEGEQLDKLTDEHILELTRCGIHYDEEFDCLCSYA